MEENGADTAEESPHEGVPALNGDGVETSTPPPAAALSPEIDQSLYTLREYLNRKDVIKGLKRLAKKYARHEQDAEDVTQETVLKVLREDSGNFWVESELKSHLAYQVYQRFVDLYRKRRRAEENGDYSDSVTRDDGSERSVDYERMEIASKQHLRNPFEVVSDIILEEKLLQAINGLYDDEEKSVSLLWFGLQGGASQTQSEIAEFLGIPLERVKSKRKQALARLRVIMKRYFDDGGLANA